MNFVGIDIEDISRFRKKLEDKKFLNRIFTTSELDYSFQNKNPENHLCARFCAKEAFIKATGDLIKKKLSYNKIEILKNSTGSVCIKTDCLQLQNFNISLSISHEKDKAIAIVIVSKGE